MAIIQLSRRAVETLVVTLIAAAVSGLAFVAYKYPLGYRKLALPLGICVAFFSLYAVVYGVGYVRSQISALGERLRERPSEPLSAYDYLISGMNQKVAWLAKIVVVCGLILGYLALLWFLPSILGINQSASGAGGA